MRNFIVFALLILFLGCASNQGVIMKDNVSYLKLSGDATNITLQIDDNSEKIIEVISSKLLYEIVPGVHIVTVKKDGELLVQRKLYFDNQKIMEIKVK